MRICALLNIGALGTILAWSAAETWDPSVVTPPTWFPFLGLVILPYASALWLLETGRFKAGLLCAAAWGFAASFALFPWAWGPCRLNHTQPAKYLALLSLAMLPIQIVLAVSASRGLAGLDPKGSSCLKKATTCAFVYGGFICFWGLAHSPYRYGIGAESSATAALRNINEAEANYFRTHHSGFTVTLREICPLQPGADLVDPVCGTGPNGTPTTFSKHGYFFRYTARRQDGKILGFSIHAEPLLRGKSGRRSFYVDESGIIRANSVQPATVGDNPI